VEREKSLTTVFLVEVLRWLEGNAFGKVAQGKRALPEGKEAVHHMRKRRRILNTLTAPSLEAGDRVSGGGVAAKRRMPEAVHKLNSISKYIFSSSSPGARPLSFSLLSLDQLVQNPYNETI
jgi:hypothetical protein